jgi:DNA-3-methyladenine glycosylase
MNIRGGFFKRDPLTCAREMIGCELVWNGCGGVIVETEAYSVRDDQACHTFTRPSSREFVTRMSAGSVYVYLNYGVHWLLNFLVKGGSEDGFVLIRALEPKCGIQEMTLRRNGTTIKNLCSGPGKLTRALGIDGTFHGRDFLSDSGASLLHPSAPLDVQACTRIGITRSADFPWRFVAAGSRFLSVPADRRMIGNAKKVRLRGVFGPLR